MTFRRNWGEERVYYHDESRRLMSVPARWTSLIEPEPFVQVSAGRSRFRVEDLVALAGLIEALADEEVRA